MDFVIFPDHPATDPLCLCLRRDPTVRTVRHPSGRPWIMGHWADDEVVAAEAGPDRLLLFGTTSADAGTLDRLLRRLRGPDDLDSRVRELPGSFFLLAVMGPHIRCQGSLSTIRQVHHAGINGVTVAGSHPQDLAALAREAAAAGLPTGAPGLGSVDADTLALRLLPPFPPFPLAHRPAWRAVHAVPPGHCLTLGPDGRHGITRWWHPPRPDLWLEDAAEAVRDALTEAVRARARHPTLSADLSGGMDSTSLCFLAAREDTRLITTAWVCRDEANDDNAWSERGAALLRSAEHLSLSHTEAPTWYAPPRSAHADPAGPLAVVRESVRLAHQARLVAARGSRVHLVGVGGDELFAPRPVALNSLARTDFRSAARRACAARRLGRWTLVDTLRTLFGGAPYPQWLESCADRIVPGVRSGVSGADWEVVPSMPAWAHPDAVATVRRLVREAAAGEPEPFAPLRSQHETLRAAARAGEIVRGAAALTGRHGVAFEAPFLDDTVIEAALTVRLVDQVAVGSYKPLLGAAMDGILPDALRTRGTKGEHSAEVYAGLRRHRRALTALCDDSRLAGLGLIRPEVLHTALTSLQPHSHLLQPLDPTLAAEYWLRSLQETQAPVPSRPTVPAAEGA
ncbi:asparagine synthase [Streptomyces rimosus]|uniref:asparagine synthase-related protein n=1 Tax=Streptomyces rimosus TaxID=1927 RepID=UPI0004D7DC93|nr:asparagine synthase-related protein [Streptomyces rimosus]KEF17367.1 asparagine synthase [Streptomyces rimosus]